MTEREVIQADWDASISLRRIHPTKAKFVDDTPDATATGKATRTIRHTWYLQTPLSLGYRPVTGVEHQLSIQLAPGDKPNKIFIFIYLYSIILKSQTLYVDC